MGREEVMVVLTRVGQVRMRSLGCFRCSTRPQVALLERMCVGDEFGRCCDGRVMCRSKRGDAASPPRAHTRRFKCKELCKVERHQSRTNEIQSLSSTIPSLEPDSKQQSYRKPIQSGGKSSNASSSNFSLVHLFQHLLKRVPLPIELLTNLFAPAEHSIPASGDRQRKGRANER